MAVIGWATIAEAKLAVPERQSCGPAIGLVLGAEFGPAQRMPGVPKDARDMKRALEAVGVETKLLLNQDVAGARAAVKAFAADRPGVLHILYFAGAGGEEAGAPERLWFLASEPGAPPGNVAEATLAFEEIAAEVGRGGQPSLVVVDSSLGDVRPRTARQVVVLAGDRGREDSDGGFLTQAIAGRLIGAAAGVDVELADVFAGAAAQARSRSGAVEDPILILRASAPAIAVRGGVLECHLP